MEDMPNLGAGFMLSDLRSLYITSPDCIHSSCTISRDTTGINLDKENPCPHELYPAVIF